jgi:hypothetical protein
MLTDIREKELKNWEEVLLIKSLSLTEERQYMKIEPVNQN